MSSPRRIALGVTAVVTAWLWIAAPVGQAAGPEAAAHDPAAALVDAVPTPRLAWTPCDEGAQCADVALPLDYDHPRGPTVRVSLLKVPATDPAKRIGSLFLNPGGPGGSGKDIARRAQEFLSPEVRARFDLVGMDPRGTNDSTRLQCYPDAASQAEDTAVLDLLFPVGSEQEQSYRRAARHLATRCSTAGRPLSASMSTAEVARDMDVLRRAVGDRRLTFLGWSYGTYLGQVYADLFPGRVRAVALDGVVDAVGWQGTPQTRHLPLTVRLNSAGGSSRALTTVLRRCQQAGAPRCPLMPDPAAAFAEVAANLRAQPLVITDDDGQVLELSYADFLQTVLQALYHPEAVEDVPLLVDLIRQLQAPSASGAEQRRVGLRYTRVRERVETKLRSTPAAEELANDYELNAAVACSDSRNPRNGRRWDQLAAAEDRRAPYFGRFWLWSSVVCARWTAVDEDAVRSRFDHPTSHPVLVVGNYYDPATNYASAVAVARRLPGSRLLSSDSWGHTAYGTSACVTSAMDRYLISGRLPTRGTVCRGDIQPYR